MPPVTEVCDICGLEGHKEGCPEATEELLAYIERAHQAQIDAKRCIPLQMAFELVKE